MSKAHKRLKELQEGMETLKQYIPDIVQGFFGYADTVGAAGALDAKTKELIGIGIIAYHRCEDCAAAHVHKAMELGASRQEIIEAAAVATIYGGGPSLAMLVTHILPAIEQFEKEMEKSK
jgi:AhpD family alkylhydroperoxidase